MTARTAQAVIYFDGLSFRCESTGQNGMRDKIPLPLDFESANPELAMNLRARFEQIKSAERQKLMDAQGRNISYVIENHGLGLARRVWTHGQDAFSRRYKKHLAGDLGNHDTNPNAKPKVQPIDIGPL